MSGLQRRRVQGHPEERDRPATSEHTVGYDPAEASNGSGEEHARPKLTLMEEVLLIGIKDKQGYLSFWNDSISYVLRGCIILELALQGKIAMVADPLRRRLPIQDRLVQVVDDKLTGEVLLDETVKIMKVSEPLSVNNWIDYLSGETWNVSKISFQLKQVRERLAKGLVDKGILRTEKRNFFFFDMPTHPVADVAVKEAVKRRVVQFVTGAQPVVEPSEELPAALPYRYVRTLSLAASAYAANVLENAMASMGYDTRDQAYARAEELINDYSEYPFERRTTPWAQALLEEVDKEVASAGDDAAIYMEVVAAVLRVYTQLDAIL